MPRLELQQQPGATGAGIPVLLLLSAFLMGAGPLRVDRVRVPSDRVASSFPAGTEIKAVPTAEVDRLIEKATRPERPRGAAVAPRLLRARHQARWEEGALDGYSELVLWVPPRIPAAFELAPWNLPLTPRPQAAPPRWFTADDGRFLLRLERPGEEAVRLPWRRPAIEGSSGRRFLLDLPRCEINELVLDLPVGLAADVRLPARTEPGPAGPGGRRSWRFEGPTDGQPVEVRITADSEPADERPTAWVSGSTELEIGDAKSSWTASWNVEFTDAADRELTIELDPRLVLTAVEGPKVGGFQLLAGETGRQRVRVRFKDDMAGTATRLDVLALVQVPTDGAWTIPAASPASAVWTGGVTTARLDGSSRELVSWRVLGTGSVAAAEPAPDRPTTTGARLAFVTPTADPVAELVFRRPGLEATTEVVGRFHLDRDPPRLEADVFWTIARGRPSALAVDLPAGWRPESVELREGGELVTWHVEPLPGGKTRYWVPAPATEPPQGVALRVTAEASFPLAEAPIALPRVQPLPGRVVDERWSAVIEPGMALIPLESRGLCWFEAPETGGLFGLPAPPAVAWRWIAPEAIGTIQLRRSGSRAVVETVEVVTIGRDHLDLDYRLRIEPDGRRAPLIVWLSEQSASPVWQRVGEEADSAKSLRRLGPDEMEAQGLARDALAWRIEVGDPAAGWVEWRGRLHAPWPGRGNVPLLRVQGHPATRGLVVVVADRALLCQTEAAGLDRLATSAVTWTDLGLADGTSSPTPPGRIAHAFAHSNIPDDERLTITTQRLEASTALGVITEAVLHTRADPGGRLLSRLSLDVTAAAPRVLEITFPAGSTLLGASVEGRTVRPGIRNGIVRIPLPAPVAASDSVPVRLELEYLAEPRTSGLDRKQIPLWPEFSMPCLSYLWQEGIDGDGTTEGVAPGLVELRPPVAGDGSIADGLEALRQRLAGAPATSAQRLIDASQRVIPAAVAAEWSLGRLLRRLDAGRSPVLVDRLALGAAGLGPASRLIRMEPALRGTAAVENWLGRMGLAVTSTAGRILFTTTDELNRTRWGTGWASSDAGPDPVQDGGGRFLSVDRWSRVANQPDRSAPAGSDASGLRDAVASRWYAASVGDPPKTARIVSSRRSETATAWGVGLGLLALGVALRKRPAGVRAALVGLVVGAGWLLRLAGASWSEGPALGLLGGGLACAGFWLGRPPAGRPGAVEPSRRPSSLATSSGVAALALAAVTLDYGRIVQSAAGPDEPTERILLIIPDEQPDQAYLALDDWLLLRNRAEPPAVAGDPAPAPVLCSAVEHRVAPTQGQSARVTSTYTLHQATDGPSSWNVPLSNGREIQATIDGQSVPLEIRPDLVSARVWIQGRGRHELVVRQMMDGEFREGQFTLPVAIKPSAMARLVVDRSPRGCPATVNGLPVKPLDGERACEVLPGPVDWLKLRWPADLPPADAAAHRSAEELVLWDALPAGDRIRVRATIRGATAASQVRLAVDPAVILRTATAPGLVTVRIEPGGEQAVLTARFDPPLPPGETLVLDLWRPVHRDRARSRGIPRVEALDVESRSVVLGFRRPGDWTGRLGTEHAPAVVPDDVFVRSWGTLPEPVATFSGAIRYTATPAEPVETGPVEAPVVVRPAVRVGIQPGRLWVRIDAEFDGTGITPSLPSLAVPEGMNLCRVEGQGVAWSVVPGGRLLLRLDPSRRGAASLMVEGWIPSAPMTRRPDEDLAGEPIPWPRWSGCQQEPGLLTILAPSSVTFRLSPEPPLAATTGKIEVPRGMIMQGPFRIEPRDGPPATLLRQPPQAGSRVAVQATLTTMLGTAALDAIVRYRVTGGPIETLTLRLPADWSTRASVKALGLDETFEQEAKGDAALWTLRLTRPVWGFIDVRIRGELPFDPARGIAFPDVSPRGRGNVTTELVVVNATGQPLVSEGSGLQEIGARSSAEGRSMPLRSVPRRTYRIMSDSWRMVLRGSRPEADSGRVRFADLSCTVLSDGATIGRGHYQLGPSAPALLAFTAAPGVELLAAVADGIPTVPWRSPNGGWLVSLGDAGASVVDLAWRTPGPARGLPEGPIKIVHPSGGVDVGLLTVWLPDGAKLGGNGSAETAIAPALGELVRAEQESARLIDSLGRFDRGSPSARSRLLSDLVRLERQSLAAQRLSEDPEPNRLAAGLVAGRLSRLRSRVRDELEAAGLGEFIQSAAVRAGGGGTDPLADLPDREPARDPLPAPWRGTPHVFLFSGGSTSRTPAVSWSPRESSRAGSRSQATALALLLLAAVAGIWRVRERIERAGTGARLATAVGLAALVAMVHPAGSLVLLSALVLGRLAPG
jgi:hypothetical protein